MAKKLAQRIESMVVDEDSYRMLERKMQKDLKNLNKPIEALGPYQRDVQIILTIKRNIVDTINAHIADYRPLCQAANELDFEIYTLAAACLLSDAVLKDLIENFRPYHRLSPVKAKLSQLKKEGHCLKRFGGLLDGDLWGPQALTSLIRQGLLLFEQQDPWGYNPLLLAITNNDLAITRAFLQAKLFTDRIWVHNDDGNYKNYHLLDHAPTEAMLELLLKHFFDPNQKHHLLDRTPDNLRLLNYGHNLQTDSHHQTVLDKLIYQQFEIDKPASFLIRLLEYQEQGVQSGPYDDDIIDDIQAILIAHNQKITRRQQQSAARAKIKSYASLTTFFSAPASADDFYSEIKAIHQLTFSEREQLTNAFADRFKMREDDSLLARQRFFEQHVLGNGRYYIEVFKNKVTDKVAAFFCFQLRHCDYPDPDIGPFNLFYASLAVCIDEAAQSGLLSAAFKVILMAKHIANEQGLPLKFYARLGRPGIAYLLLPKEAKISTKYAVDEALVNYIASCIIGNTPEIGGGSSLPPVLSTVDRSHSNWRLKEFDHLLDDELQASKQASLLAVCDVDDAFSAGLYRKLNKSHHITPDYIANAAEALKARLDAESQEVMARM